VLQGQKFDPDGADVRRFVPEPARLPAPAIHQPWRAAPLELKGAGVELGDTYPAPIVDHMAARKRALRAYSKLRDAREKWLLFDSFENLAIVIASFKHLGDPYERRQTDDRTGDG
jgi:hypothetical protein